MSALPPKADISGGSTDVRFVPKADSCTATYASQKSLHIKSLVGARSASVAPQGGTPLDSWVLRHPFTKPPPAVSRHALTWVQSRMGGQETTGAGNGHGSRN